MNKIKLFTVPVLLFFSAAISAAFAQTSAPAYLDTLKQLNISILNKPTYDAYFNRATLMYRFGDYTGAIRDFTEAIALNATDKTAYNLRGKTKISIGEVQGALLDFEKAIQLDSTIAEYYINHGIAKRIIGNYQEAIADCNKAIELQSDNADAYNNRGLSKFYSGEEGAIEDYSKAISLNQNYAEAYSNRADYYYYDENNTDACADWTKAVELGYEKAKRSMAKYCTTTDK